MERPPPGVFHGAKSTRLARPSTGRDARQGCSGGRAISAWSSRWPRTASFFNIAHTLSFFTDLACATGRTGGRAVGGGTRLSQSPSAFPPTRAQCGGRKEGSAIAHTTCHHTCHVPADFGNKESFGVWLGSVGSTAPEWPLGVGQRHPDYHCLSRDCGTSGEGIY